MRWGGCGSGASGSERAGAAVHQPRDGGRPGDRRLLAEEEGPGARGPDGVGVRIAFGNPTAGTPFQGDYHRDSSRPAPDNLYTSTPEIYTTAGNAGGPPGPVFTYLPAPAGATGAPPPTSAVTGTAAPGASLHVPFSGPDYDV